MIDERTSKAVAQILKVVMPALKSVLAERIKDHYSENAWDEIVSAVSDEAGERLARDFHLGELLSENQMFDAKGRVNVEGMVKAFHSLIESGMSQGDEARVKHLTQYLRHTADQLKLSRR